MKHSQGEAFKWSWCGLYLVLMGMNNRLRGCLEGAFSCMALLFRFPSPWDLCGGEPPPHGQTASAADSQVAFRAVGNIRGR